MDMHSLSPREPVRGNYQASPSFLPQRTPHCNPLSCFSRPCWKKRFLTMDDEPSFLFLSNLLGFWKIRTYHQSRAAMGQFERGTRIQTSVPCTLPGHVMIPESCRRLSFP